MKKFFNSRSLALESPHWEFARMGITHILKLFLPDRYRNHVLVTLFVPKSFIKHNTVELDIKTLLSLED
uniref:Uncharacterized protein n=1 Tax=Romanomermis culicivorax TaxID=13658 RepID=A0A915JAR2_ROMCU